MAASEQFYVAAERRIERLTWLIGAVAAAYAAFRYGWRFGAGLLGGAIIGWLNFRWLKQGVGAAVEMMAKQSQRKAAQSSVAAETGRDASGLEPGSAQTEPAVKLPKRIYVRLLARYALLLVTVYVTLTARFVPGMAVLCGLFALVAAVLTELVYELLFAREA